MSKQSLPNKSKEKCTFLDPLKHNQINLVN